MQIRVGQPDLPDVEPGVPGVEAGLLYVVAAGDRGGDEHAAADVPAPQLDLLLEDVAVARFPVDVLGSRLLVEPVARPPELVAGRRRQHTLSFAADFSRSLAKTALRPAADGEAGIGEIGTKADNASDGVLGH